MPLTGRRTATAAPETDFDLRALYEALDERRRSRDLTWAALTAEVNRHRTRLHPIAQSTITSLKKKSVGEGDAIFKRSFGSAERRRALCPALRTPTRRAFSYQRCRGGQILRWATRALFAARNARRQERGRTWTAVARDVPGVTAAMLTNLATGPRIGFPV